MNHKALNPLDPDLVTVLRAMVHMNLSATSLIAQRAGRSVNGALQTLRDGGYVHEHAARQRDGLATMLYSLSAKGAAALNAMGAREAARPLPALAASRSSGPDPAVYDGHEMRPYDGRAGAMDAFKHPSRVGKHLYHPDGSVTPVK